MKNGKRILKVKVIRVCDDSPDTSHLGEYGNDSTSEFSIDRAHAEDCASLPENHPQIESLEHAIAYLDKIRRSPEVADNPNSTEWEGLDNAIDILTDAQEDCQECDCTGGQMARNEYRYFNPSFNYVGKDGKPTDGLTPEDVRKYTRQDYDRMESLNVEWCYIGIRAEAEIALRVGEDEVLLTQTITSGGLYGIESDSDKEYLSEVQNEELANLKLELTALGFSKRAISKAFQNVAEVSL